MGLPNPHQTFAVLFPHLVIQKFVMKLGAQAHLHLAKRHLEKVRAAWDELTDWADLAIYGFYCLEQAVLAGATEYVMRGKKQHRGSNIATGYNRRIAATKAKDFLT